MHERMGPAALFSGAAESLDVKLKRYNIYMIYKD